MSELNYNAFARACAIIKTEAESLERMADVNGWNLRPTADNLRYALTLIGDYLSEETKPEPEPRGIPSEDTGDLLTDDEQHQYNVRRAQLLAERARRAAARIVERQAGTPTEDTGDLELDEAAHRNRVFNAQKEAELDHQRWLLETNTGPAGLPTVDEGNLEDQTGWDPVPPAPVVPVEPVLIELSPDVRVWQGPERAPAPAIDPEHVTRRTRRRK